MKTSRLSALGFLCLVAIAASLPAQANWPNWRGPNYNGSAEGNPPTEWSESKNIKWKVSVPGHADSTPVVWKDHIFVMTAVKTERDGKAAPKKEEATNPEGDDRRDRRRRRRRGGRRGGFHSGAAPTKIYEFFVVALDRKTGKEAWRTKVKEGVPHEGGHSTGSQASGSPITDGKHIWAFFGSRGIFCLDMKGKIKWHKQLGIMRTRNQFGEGGSPALHGNTLVIPGDHEGQSFVVALDATTGKEKWKRERSEVTTWSTPAFAKVGNKTQVILTGTSASRGYDLETGKVIWKLGGMTTNCIPSPIVNGDTVYLMSGFRGASLQAVHLPGAKGDLDESKNVKWSYNRNTSYVPSALHHGGHLYFLRSNNGVLTCINAKTGEAKYEAKRLAGLRTVYASPVGVENRLYITSRNGVTKVLKAGAEPEEIAENALDDEFDASAVVLGDEILLRGKNSLYCIANMPEKKGEKKQ